MLSYRICSSKLRCKSEIFFRVHFFYHTLHRYNVDAATSLTKRRHCARTFFRTPSNRSVFRSKEEQRQIEMMAWEGERREERAGYLTERWNESRRPCGFGMWLIIPANKRSISRRLSAKYRVQAKGLSASAVGPMTARHWHAHSRNSYMVGHIMAGARAAARLRIYFWPLAPRVGAERINHKIYNSRPPRKKRTKKSIAARNRTARDGRDVLTRANGANGEKTRVLLESDLLILKPWGGLTDVYPASSHKKKGRRTPVRSHGGTRTRRLRKLIIASEP